MKIITQRVLWTLALIALSALLIWKEKYTQGAIAFGIVGVISFWRWVEITPEDEISPAEIGRLQDAKRRIGYLTLGFLVTALVFILLIVFAK